MKGMCDVLLLVIVMLGVLVGVAFLTLFERKVLGYVQCRSGPNSVGVCGVFQPFSDAMSLLSKEQVSVVGSNYFLYFLVPGGGLVLSLVMWFLFPLVEGFLDLRFGLLFFLCCSSLGVYFIMVGGWSSNSSYGVLGAYRAVAQTISYEVSMALILLLVVAFGAGFDFELYRFSLWFGVGWGLVFVAWLVTCLAELNRTPFDFAEGESELVSGFNVEYAGGLFALIFISEYANIFLLGLVTSLVFFGGGEVVLSMLLVVVCFLVMRGTVARYRYDKLMMLVWSSILFSVLMLLVLIFGVLSWWWCL
uniref:NADH dehydrogenase subunit 1 n=1 Tax=Charinus ferreus TaxID=3034938 RepID=UPI002410CFFE|nr:NADH dehydrogenase subunit 1 [Charinus ferreus]WEM34695.1 NADH dehydrogenase subunit 1 [Charinus ferreus]WEM34708.1 NADH dehydrogenase subunit 1 [Charinus ferreus]WEM34721.1 NADH dehydrogenase subunit 1 [Charinus ferreus]